MNRWIVTAAAALMCLGASSVMAQQDNGGGPGGGGPGGGRRGFDPAAMMERVKGELEVTNAEEWTALQPLVQKVMDARREIGFGGGMRGMMGGRRGGNQNGDQGGGPQRPGMPTPSAEATALQKAIEDKAPKADLKVALDKYVASRKSKQAALEQAQDNLRKFLTPRQEAIATLNGLL